MKISLKQLDPRCVLILPLQVSYDSVRKIFDYLLNEYFHSESIWKTGSCNKEN